MFLIRVCGALLLAAAIGSAPLAQGEIPSRAERLIAHGGVGRLRLGMTLDEARRAVPAATFKRASDGDGAALVEVRLSPTGTLIVSAGEDDPDAPIDWRRAIRAIETRAPEFHTADGVHPGSLVKDVIKVYGAVKTIIESEVESRQYIAFDNQPEWLILRLDYTGIFANGAHVTRQYDPAARIYSIAISAETGSNRGLTPV